jgi:hypothetical protein
MGRHSGTLIALGGARFHAHFCAVHPAITLHDLLLDYCRDFVGALWRWTFPELVMRAN